MGGRARQAARLGICAVILASTGCATRSDDQAVMDSLSDMEIRIRMLQSELNNVHRTLTDTASVPGAQAAAGGEVALTTRLDDLQQRIDTLPAQLAEFCPRPTDSASVSAQCDPSPDVQRVVVSGDKLVVGDEERIWLEPPSSFFVAHVDAAAEHSLLHAREVVEFERDGNKWVRFEVTADEETVSVERPLKRMTRLNGDRHPTVELRVQLGDVRETVEFALTELAEQMRPLVLGRNFLTDVALVDVARKYVQPAFRAPNR